MKRLILAVAATLLLAGCGDDTYSKAMEQGKLALASKEYEKALGSFELALDEKPNDQEAKTYYEALQAYSQMSLAFERGDFETALANADSILQDAKMPSSLKTTTETVKERIETIKMQQADMESELSAIEDLIESKNYAKAETMMSALNGSLTEENADAGFAAKVQAVDERLQEALEVQRANEKKKEQVVVEKQIVVESTKSSYLHKLDRIEAGLSDLDHMYEEGTTVDMIEAATETYRRWDVALNEIWAELKKQLPEKEMAALRTKQRQWIKDRDREAERSKAMFEGGSFANVQYPITQGELTKQRCYELVYDYMK